MTELPAYYPKYYTRYVRFAIVLLIIGLLSGVAYQESAKKAPVSELLPLGAHLEMVYHLSLLHGHAILMGTLIPLAMLWMLHLGVQLNFRPVSEKGLRIASALFLPGAALATALILYKGYYFLLSVRSAEFLAGQLSYHNIEAGFFGGQEVLRKIVYATVHIALSSGLITLAVLIWRSFGKPNLPENAAPSQTAGTV
jgi:hypothetical protein